MMIIIKNPRNKCLYSSNGILYNSTEEMSLIHILEFYYYSTKRLRNY
jgi:hypothetical protein